MHTALYREFRPAAFDELIGQDHIVRILKNQIKSGNTSHAYLFSGTRGTGKTTTARILAKALNCTGEGEKPCCLCDSCKAIAEGSFVDVIEMDAASHRGVSEIQEITDAVMYSPAAGRYKVYIIDEVHMLSTEAFNALLKTLEEPPAHIVFILATTEPQKVPATILSRVMKLDFRRVPEKLLIDNMKGICESRQIEAEEAALSLIAVNADGSVRDSLSILEQCICPGEPLRRDDVAEILGTSGVEPLLRMTDLVLDQNPSGALLLLEEILSSGVETGRFMKEWLGHFRNLLIAGYVNNPEDLLNMSGENTARLKEQAGRISQSLLENAIRELTETISQTRWSRYPRVMLEMTIVKLSAPQREPEPIVRPISAAVRTTPAAEGRPSVTGNVPDASAVPTQKPIVPPASAEGRPSVTGNVPDASAVPMQKPVSPEPVRQQSRRPEQTAAPVVQTALSNGMSSEIWTQVIDEAAKQKGLFVRLVSRTSYQKTSEDQVYIACADEATQTLLSGRAKGTVEQLLEQRLGRHLNVIAVIPKRGENSRKEELARQKEMLDTFFGMDVDVH